MTKKMRLAVVARKLNLPVSAIVMFLRSEGIDLDSNIPETEIDKDLFKVIKSQKVMIRQSYYSDIGFSIRDSHNVGFDFIKNLDSRATKVGYVVPALASYIEVKEGTKGITFHKLFGEFLIGASSIKVYDPYIRDEFQFTNLRRLIKVIDKVSEENVRLKVISNLPRKESDAYKENLICLKEWVRNNTSIQFKFECTESFHLRKIVIDDRKSEIILDRGLDIYHRSKGNGDLNNLPEDKLKCKKFYAVYFKRNS